MLKQIVSTGPVMPLRQWTQTDRPRRYLVKIYLDKIDKLGNYESILP